MLDILNKENYHQNKKKSDNQMFKNANRLYSCIANF